MVLRVVVAQEVEVAAEPAEIISTVDLLVCLVLLVLKVVYYVHCFVFIVNLNQFAVAIAFGLTKSKLTSLSLNRLVFLKDLVFYLNASTLVIGYKRVHAVFAVLTHISTLNYCVKFSLLLLTSIV